MKRVMLTMLALPAATSAQTAPITTLQPGETLLEVQAEGQAKFRPDAAFVSVGVVSTGTTAREATDANATQMAAVIAAVKKAGVDGRYIRTQQISVKPRFARSGQNDWQGQAQITGYVARNSVALTVVKLMSAGDVIAAAFGAGANLVNGPNLESDDPAKGLAEARRAAIGNARREADDYAASLDMRVSRVLQVSERGRQSRVVDYVRPDGIVLTPIAAPPAPPLPVAPGEMERTVSIWIDYALVPAR